MDHDGLFQVASMQKDETFDFSAEKKRCVPWLKNLELQLVALMKTCTGSDFSLY